MEIQSSTIQLGKCANVAKTKPLEINTMEEEQSKLLIIDYVSGICTVQDNPITHDYESWIESQGYQLKNVQWLIVNSVEFKK